jgi:hypothetical protein
MLPNALPLFVREPESFRIYSGSTAVGNFEIDSSKKERIVTRAEHRRLIARRLFDASAQYPNKYVNLVLPRNEADDVLDLTVPKSEE